MFRTGNFKNNSFRHTIWRLLSFFGIDVIKILKSFLIYRPRNNSLKYVREVDIGKNYISVFDKIHNAKKNDKLERVFNISKRHTASSNNFSKNDYIRLKNMSLVEENHRFENKSLLIKTVYK